VYASVASTDGVRLKSHRPSVSAKIERLAGCEDAVLTGQGWPDRLKALLAQLARPERALVLALPLGDPDALPLPAQTVLDRARTDWFADFLSQGDLRPRFQAVVSLRDGVVVGRQARAAGRLGATEVRGEELREAAQAHDALFSFDARVRARALQVGLPLLGPGERLFVVLETRCLLDVESSLRSVWPVVERLGADPTRVCLELASAGRCPDQELLRDVVAAHRARGAAIALSDVCADDTLGLLEVLRPDVARLSRILTTEVERSPARRALVAAMVAFAHEHSCRVMAEWIEQMGQYQALRELGVDLGQGFYFGQPTERPVASQARRPEGG